MDGWIKLYRKVTEDEWYFAEKFTREQAWLDLLLLAAYKPRKFFIRGIEVNVEIGQVAMSLDMMEKRWSWSRNKVLRFISELQKQGKVKLQKSNVINIISIVKFDLYQECETANETANGTTNETTDETANETTDQEKESGKEKESSKEIENNKEKENTKESKEISQPLSLRSKGLSHSNADATQPKNFREKVILYFNKKMEGRSIKPVKAITEGTKRSEWLKARVREYGRDAIFQMIDNAADSQFLNGYNSKGFVASFDWLIRPNNFIKVFEGNYNNDSNGTNRTNNQAEQTVIAAAEAISELLADNRQ